MINTIRQAAMWHINLADMVKYWEKATEKERPDWTLPLKVAQAIEPEYVPDDNAAAVMAATGCRSGHQHGACFSELGHVFARPP